MRGNLMTLELVGAPVSVSAVQSTEYTLTAPLTPPNTAAIAVDPAVTRAA